MLIAVWYGFTLTFVAFGLVHAIFLIADVLTWSNRQRYWRRHAGLAKLANLKRLRALDVRYSRATNAGVRELVAAVPDCKVMYLNSSNREVKREAEAAAVAGKGEPAIGENERRITRDRLIKQIDRMGKVLLLR